MNIDQLTKKIEDLEARVIKLESLAGSSSNALSPSKETIKDIFKINLFSYEREEDGSKKKYWKSAKKVNYDTKSKSMYTQLYLSSSGKVFGLRPDISYGESDWYQKGRNEAFMALTEMADEKNYTFTFTIPNNLPEDGKEAFSLLKEMTHELVKKFGKGGNALFSDYFIEYANTNIKRYNNNELGEVVKYLSDPIIIGREWSNKPFENNPSWSQEERYNAVKEYVQSLKRKYQD